MSTLQLPKLIEPLKFCQKAGRGGQSTLSGTIDIGKNIKSHDTLLVQAELHFGQDQMGFNLITGRLQTCLSLRCERCLEQFDYPLDINLSLSPISSEKELDSLPDYVEPLMLQADGTVSIESWMTEEVHLALPMVPKHENTANCHLTLPTNKQQ